MKVLLSANSAWYVYNFRRNLIVQLIHLGHEVSAISPPDEYVPRLQEIGCEHTGLTLDNMGTNPLKEVVTVGRYYRAYRRIQPDCILHFTSKPNIYGSFAASLLGIPVINNISGLGTAFMKQGLLMRIVSLLYRLSQRQAYRVFFQNKDDRALFLERNLVSESRTAILPGSGVNISDFDPDRYPDRDIPSGTEMRFLFIGRFIRDKGLFEFVTAAKLVQQEYPSVSFQLLGFIDYNNPGAMTAAELEEWTSSGLIEYLGRHDDVRPFITAADCVVLPSYREGTPRTLLEAAALGKPLVAADSVGCREPVDHGVNGLLCKVKDAQDLADAMLHMIRLTPEQRMEMGRNSREKMKQEYDEVIVTRKYIEVIHEIA